MILSHDGKQMTSKETEVMSKNLNAFEENFGEIILFKCSTGGFAVFLTQEDFKNNAYVQYCENVHYLSGWLYGVVQGDRVRIIMKRNQKDV